MPNICQATKEVIPHAVQMAAQCKFLKSKATSRTQARLRTAARVLCLSLQRGYHLGW